MILSLLVILASIWTVICFLDIIFKSCMLYPYLNALEQSGVTIRLGHIQWYITRFNRTFQKWGRYKPFLLRKWFAVGALVTCLCIVPAVVLLLVTAINFAFIKEPSQLDSQVLQPVVPGINLPLSQLFYYIITLLVCSVFHELGHALAAVREEVRIQGCGFFILGAIPGAFVDLPNEQVMFLSPWRQLHVFSAGIWHNIILALLSLALLFTNPLLLSPAFQKNSGVTVLDVAQESGAAGPAGLFSGDQITAINMCLVTDEETWKECIAQTAINFQSGYCVTRYFVFTEDSREGDLMHRMKDCCRNSSSRLCFQYDFTYKFQGYACLPVRKVLESSRMCNFSSDCGSVNINICAIPVLLSPTDRLIQITRKHKNAMLFYGPPSELFYSVTISPWVAKFSILSVQVVQIYETFLKYLISFSGGLAILNLVPCPALDGQWLCQSLMELLFSSLLPQKAHRNFVVCGLKCFGLILIVANVMLGLHSLLLRS